MPCFGVILVHVGLSSSYRIIFYWLQVTADGSIIAEDGSTVSNIDAVILATGFDVAASLQSATISVQGIAGQDLNQTLATTPHGVYMGLAVPGFPNMFTLLGPNSWLGHNSMIFMTECAVNLIVKVINKLGSCGGKLRWWEVSESALRRFSAEARVRLQGSVWLSGGCSSWYLPAGQGKAGSTVTGASVVDAGSVDAVSDVAGAAQRDQDGSRANGTAMGDGDTVIKTQTAKSRLQPQSYCVMWMGSCIEYWWRTLWPRKADWKCGVVE